MLSIKVERRITPIGTIHSINCPITRKREIAYFCKHCKYVKEITGNDIVECLWKEQYRETWKQ